LAKKKIPQKTNFKKERRRFMGGKKGTNRKGVGEKGGGWKGGGGAWVLPWEFSTRGAGIIHGGGQGFGTV